MLKKSNAMTTDLPPPSGTGPEQTACPSMKGKNTKIKIPSVEAAILTKTKTWNISCYTVQPTKTLGKISTSYNNLT